MVFSLLVCFFSSSSFVLADKNLHQEKNLIEDDRNVLDLYKSDPKLFQKDIEKFKYSKAQMSMKSLRTVVPIVLAGTLLFIAGPPATAPMAFGAFLGTESFLDWKKKKAGKKLIAGAYQYLLTIEGHGTLSIIKPEKQDKYMKFYRKFFRKIETRLRENVYSNDESSEVLQKEIALLILRVNRFSSLFINKFLDQPKLWKKGRFSKFSIGISRKGAFSAKFYKKHIELLACFDREIFSSGNDFMALNRIVFGEKN